MYNLDNLPHVLLDPETPVLEHLRSRFPELSRYLPNDLVLRELEQAASYDVVPIEARRDRALNALEMTLKQFCQVVHAVFYAGNGGEGAFQQQVSMFQTNKGRDMAGPREWGSFSLGDLARIAGSALKDAQLTMSTRGGQSRVVPHWLERVPALSESWARIDGRVRQCNAARLFKASFDVTVANRHYSGLLDDREGDSPFLLCYEPPLRAYLASNNLVANLDTLLGPVVTFRNANAHSSADSSHFSKARLRQDPRVSRLLSASFIGAAVTVIDAIYGLGEGADHDWYWSVAEAQPIQDRAVLKGASAVTRNPLGQPVAKEDRERWLVGQRGSKMWVVSRSHSDGPLAPLAPLHKNIISPLSPKERWAQKQQSAMDCLKALATTLPDTIGASVLATEQQREGTVTKHMQRLRTDLSEIELATIRDELRAMWATALSNTIHADVDLGKTEWVMTTEAFAKLCDFDAGIDESNRAGGEVDAGKTHALALLLAEGVAEHLCSIGRVTAPKINHELPGLKVWMLLPTPDEVDDWIDVLGLKASRVFSVNLTQAAQKRLETESASMPEVDRRAQLDLPDDLGSIEISDGSPKNVVLAIDRSPHRDRLFSFLFRSTGGSGKRLGLGGRTQFVFVIQEGTSPPEAQHLNGKPFNTPVELRSEQYCIVFEQNFPRDKFLLTLEHALKEGAEAAPLVTIPENASQPEEAPAPPPPVLPVPSPARELTRLSPSDGDIAIKIEGDGWIAGDSVPEFLTTLIEFGIQKRWQPLSEDQLPFKVGRTRYLVARDPVHLDGKPFVSPEEATFWVETHWGRAQALVVAQKLCTAAGITLLESTLRHGEIAAQASQEQTPTPAPVEVVEEVPVA